MAAGVPLEALLAVWPELQRDSSILQGPRKFNSDDFERRARWYAATVESTLRQVPAEPRQSDSALQWYWSQEPPWQFLLWRAWQQRSLNPEPNAGPLRCFRCWGGYPSLHGGITARVHGDPCFRRRACWQLGGVYFSISQEDTQR